jgi:hypothetical protein
LPEYQRTHSASAVKRYELRIDLGVVVVRRLLRDDRGRQRAALLVRAGEDDDPALTGAGGGGGRGDGTDRTDDRPRGRADRGDPERLARLDELPDVVDLRVVALVRGDGEVRVRGCGRGRERGVRGRNWSSSHCSLKLFAVETGSFMSMEVNCVCRGRALRPARPSKREIDGERVVRRDEVTVGRDGHVLLLRWFEGCVCCDQRSGCPEDFRGRG